MTTIINHLVGECSDIDYSGDLFTLSDTVPNWSIWSESYHTLRSQRVKENINSSRVSDLECHAGSKRTAEEAEIVESEEESAARGPSASVGRKRRRSERVLVQLNGRVEVSAGLWM